MRTPLSGGGIGRTKSGAERIVADQVAEHPQNVRGLGAVVDGRGGASEGLTCTFAGAGGFNERQRLAAGLKRAESLIAVVLMVVPERAHEVGRAFVEPVGLGAIQAWVRAWDSTEAS